MPIFCDGNVLNCCQKETVLFPALCSFSCLAHTVPLPQLNAELIQLGKSSVDLPQPPHTHKREKKGKNPMSVGGLRLTD